MLRAAVPGDFPAPEEGLAAAHPVVPEESAAAAHPVALEESAAAEGSAAPRRRAARLQPVVPRQREARQVGAVLRPRVARPQQAAPLLPAGRAVPRLPAGRAVPRLPAGRAVPRLPAGRAVPRLPAGPVVRLAVAGPASRQSTATTSVRTDGKVVQATSQVAQQKIVESGTFGQHLSGALHASQGHWHACAATSGGHVYCWATNQTNGNVSGQLGNGAIGGSFIPYEATRVKVSGGQDLTNVKAISSGSTRCYSDSTTCAVKTDGTVWCWGDETASGNLFNGTGGTADSPYAVQIMASASTPLTGVDAVSVGRRHACVNASGQVKCWGLNIAGALGVGDQTTRKYPTTVALPGPALQLGAGFDTTCARVGDEVYCWGYNNHGQLGIGPPSANHDGCINFCKLTAIGTLTGPGVKLKGVVDLHMNYLNVCARRTDNSVWCWGAGAGHYAAPLMLGGNPATNIAQINACGSSSIPGNVRLLTQDGKLRHGANTTITPDCGP